MKMCECAKLYSQLFPFWDKLSEEEKDALCRSTADTSFDAGQNIHGGKNECTGGILLRSGSARAYILSENGREITIARIYPGEMCMLGASCVLKSINFDVFIDAQEDLDCYVINGKTFAEITEHNIYAENYALNLAVKRFSDIMWIMQQILFMSFDKRLAIFLTEESAKTNSDKIMLTHEQIAKFMGSAREVVSRMLKYFSSEGIVSLSRGGIIITDRKKLENLAAN